DVAGEAQRRAVDDGGRAAVGIARAADGERATGDVQPDRLPASAAGDHPVERAGRGVADEVDGGVGAGAVVGDVVGGAGSDAVEVLERVEIAAADVERAGGVAG